MTLSRLQPGTDFIALELGNQRGTLLKINECRALVSWSRPPEYIHYTTCDGKEIEFYRQAKPESVTPYLKVIPVR